MTRRKSLGAVLVAALAVAALAAYLAFSAQSQTLPALRYRSGLWIQNTGGADARISLTFYDLTGTAVLVYTDTQPLAANAARDYRQSRAEFDALGNFYGSIVVAATQPVVATSAMFGGQSDNAFTNADTWTAVANAQTHYDLALIEKNHQGASTQIIAQNAGSAPADITLRYSNGASETRTSVPPGAAARFDAAIATLPDGFVGGAHISANVPIAVAVQRLSDSSRVLSGYTPTPSAATLELPYVVANDGGYFSTISIYNPGAATTVTLSFDNSVSDFAPQPETRALGANAVATLELSGGQWGDVAKHDLASKHFIGTAHIESENGAPLSAVVNHACITISPLCPYHSSGASYAANGAEQAANSFYVPLIVASDHYYSGLAIENVAQEDCRLSIIYGANRAGDWQPANEVSPPLPYRQAWYPAQRNGSGSQWGAPNDPDKLYVGSATIIPLANEDYCKLLAVTQLRNMDNYGDQFALASLSNGAQRLFIPAASHDAEFAPRGVGHNGEGATPLAVVDQAADWWFDWGMAQPPATQMPDPRYVAMIYCGTVSVASVRKQVTNFGFPASATWLLFNETDDEAQCNRSARMSAAQYDMHVRNLQAMYAEAHRPPPVLFAGGMGHLPIDDGRAFVITGTRYASGQAYWDDFLAHITLPFDGIHIHGYTWFEQCPSELSAASVNCLTARLNTAYDYFQHGPYRAKTAGKPIWITETSLLLCADPDPAHMANIYMYPLMSWFAQSMSGERPWIRRMAWYADNTRNFACTNLHDANGFTPLGRMWNAPIDW